jgi:ABC-type transport system involved in multi-copper enzyme maturation permease subunit
MKRRCNNIWLIAKTILLEAVRRQEVYVIVVLSVALLAGLRFVKFFEVEGLGKFYREMALRTMNIATGLTAVFLAARQLPREFRDRTLYPLLAKPVTRFEFILGKFAGAMLAVTFCYALFMFVFLIANYTLSTPLNGPLVLQGVYLQLWSLSVAISMTFVLSMLFNTDAALTLAAMLYLSSQILMTMMSVVFGYVGPVQQTVLKWMHYVIPQLTLFDVSGRIVHSVPLPEGGWTWAAVPAWAIWELTAYGAAYTALFLGIGYILFRRKPL